jgi:hypothetical protein
MWSDVKPYFRDRLAVLGYTKEHSDGFNRENIPATVMHNTFFIELNGVAGIKNDHDCQHTDVSVRVNLFRNGYRKPREAIDQAIADAQTIVADFIKIPNNDHPAIHNVVFDALSIVPIDDSNDNSLIIEMELRAVVIFSTR